MTPKFDIVCGEGKHRSYTCCLAELVLLNKYGNQPDYFWNAPKLHNEYIKLIKLTGKLAKIVGQPKLAWYIYKEPKINFNKDVGLIIWTLKNYKFENPKFTLEELVQIYKNRFRPKKENAENPEIQVVKEQKPLDFLGDI